ncbi:branched-chain amino acid aminotransferase [Neobacillus notoginsengisoli]|uniref:Branched-chain amino acid aminotransferase n=1 Tax=Neobacillus notoginsengisoli TaxID=1578198 RepID=A0A417Z0E2_9BACI|nr:branched-chain amino acid aminotransferase [Neobacillus notoginsengisoli]RHW43391.1 branched-chain amino acid aminotransferase [Neobacillus notoginsengisoli]
MLKTNMEKLLKRNEPLFAEEIEYAEKQGLIEEGAMTKRNSAERFKDAYIELSDKETEQTVSKGGADLVQQPVSYLKKNLNEFLYVESQWFELVDADAVVLEVDDVFRNYQALLGIKIQKKYGERLNQLLQEKFGFAKKDYSLMFDGGEGIWNFNFSLEALKDFNEERTISETLNLVYRFLFDLAQEVER